MVVWNAGTDGKGGRPVYKCGTGHINMKKRFNKKSVLAGGPHNKSYGEMKMKKRKMKTGSFLMV